MPSRYRRLDGALADLPLDEPMLLTELDGFLTGVLVCPEEIPSTEWMQVIWGVDDGSGTAPFDDPLDVQWFADAVMARRGEIARDLARGRLQPLFDVDERNGDVLWEMWIEGFAEAMALRPDAWVAVEEDAQADPLLHIDLLIAVARNESELDSMQINALQERAPGVLADAVVQFHAAHRRAGVAVAATRPAKVGRNDPCPCGSGRKSKRCCA